jgi:hypothetical protein
MRKLTLHLDGGSHGLLLNSGNLGSKKAKRTVDVTIDAHNGARVTAQPKVERQCS